MSPTNTNIANLPHVEVLAGPNDYEEHVVWVLGEDPNLEPYQNTTAIINTMEDIWAWLCNQRDIRMRRYHSLWALQPHLKHYDVNRINTKDIPVNGMRAIINISSICHFIYEMEKWYIPYAVGVDIIKAYAKKYAVTDEGIIACIRECKAMNPSICKGGHYVRRWGHVTSITSYTKSQLSDLCHDMIRDGFTTEYLSHTISNMVMESFVRRSITLNRVSASDAYIESLTNKANMYASLLIACMAINTAEIGIDNQCCIELWGAVEIFIDKRCPMSMITDLIHEVYSYKRRCRLA